MWLKQTQIEECARVAHEKSSSCFSKNDDGDDVDNNKKTTEEKEAEFYLSLPTHKRPKCEGNVKLYHFFAELREQTMKINTNHGGGGGGGGGGVSSSDYNSDVSLSDHSPRARPASRQALVTCQYKRKHYSEVSRTYLM